MPKAIDLARYGAMKPEIYARRYEKLFSDLVDKEVCLLELGVHEGGSVKLWRDYFEKGVIVGIDAGPISIEDTSGRLHVCQGNQQDTAFLDKVAAQWAPDGFDIVIDDAAHIGEYAAASFRHLFDNHLKPHGIYIIEDWGTGYLDTWPDGGRYEERPPIRTAGSLKTRFPSHDWGMVGFVKQLIDECAVTDISSAERSGQPVRYTMFEKVTFTFGQVFIFKSGEEGVVPT